MSKKKIEVEFDIPDGWELVGYYAPKKGDFYVGCDGVANCFNPFPESMRMPIVRKVEPLTVEELSSWLMTNGRYTAVRIYRHCGFEVIDSVGGHLCNSLTELTAFVRRQ